MSNTINRSEFIRRASLAGSSLVLSPYLATGADFFKGAPNTKVLLGIMGTNSRGMFLAKGFANLPLTAPGLGIELNEEVVKQHLHPSDKNYFVPTTEWDAKRSHDRIFS